MGSECRMEDRLSPELQHAIREVLNRVQCPMPVLDAAEAAGELAKRVPDAAAIGVERLRDEIVREAARNGRVAIAFSPES